MTKITDFLATEHTPEELAAALKVLHSFKSCESEAEWLNIIFAAWAKLEQLEEFLEHRVNGAPLADDTLAYMAKTDDA